MQIDYAYLNQDAARPTFYTRQLFCDVFMTVHKALVAHSLDIYHLKALPALAHSDDTVEDKMSVLGPGESLRTTDVGKYCLIAIDIMNSYGQPFEVSLGRTDEGNILSILECVESSLTEYLTLDHSARRSLEPGATAR